MGLFSGIKIAKGQEKRREEKGENTPEINFCLYSLVFSLATS